MKDIHEFMDASFTPTPTKVSIEDVNENITLSEDFLLKPLITPEPLGGEDEFTILGNKPQIWNLKSLICSQRKLTRFEKDILFNDYDLYIVRSSIGVRNHVESITYRIDYEVGNVAICEIFPQTLSEEIGSAHIGAFLKFKVSASADGEMLKVEEISNNAQANFAIGLEGDFNLNINLKISSPKIIATGADSGTAYWKLFKPSLTDHIFFQIIRVRRGNKKISLSMLLESNVKANGFFSLKVYSYKKANLITLDLPD